MATELRRRMIEDMRLRSISKSTQEHYVRSARQLADQFPRDISSSANSRLR